MRRNAGSFVRSKFIRNTVGFSGVGGALIGLSFVPTLYALYRFVGFDIAWIVYVVGWLVVLVWIVWMNHPKNRWNLANLEKGVIAEKTVGQAIERAIVAKGCGVAHSVKNKIARYGDIDHLVVTPLSIWVIETKYRRVPKKLYSETLRRIAKNVEAVREYFVDCRSVKGCLVIATETPSRKRTAKSGNTSILVYSQTY